MKTIITALLLCTGGLSICAQKIFISGYSLKITTLGQGVKIRDYANIAVLSAPDKKSKTMASDIVDSLSESINYGKAPFGILSGEFSFRFSSTRRMLKWSEWIAGIGYASPALNGHQPEILMYSYDASSNGRKMMAYDIGRRSGLLIDNRFLFNSSPYSGRLMFCGGIGFRAGYFTETNNRVRFTETYPVFPFPDISDTTVLFSNTEYGYLEGLASVGIKYRASCRISLLADISLGKGIRSYKGGLNIPAFQTMSFSFGIKYKINRSLPQDIAPADESDPDKPRKASDREVRW